MKTLRIIAIVLIIALFGAMLTACSSAKVKSQAESLAFEKFLSYVNGDAATEVILNTDSVDVSEVTYINFKAVDDTLADDKGFPVYAFKIIASYKIGDVQYNNIATYVNVIYKNDSCSAKIGNADLYEKYDKQYKPKEKELKEKEINKLLSAGIEAMKAQVAQRKLEAEQRAEAERIEREELAEYAVFADTFVTALNNANLTAELTREQLIALLPAASDTLVYVGEEVYEIEQELQEGVNYVLVPNRPAAGYLTFDLTIYNAKYTVMVCALDGVADRSEPSVR